MFIPVFNLFKYCYIFIALLCFGFSNAQTTTTIESIKEEHQKCLDNADFMLGCSYDYFNKADSLLNIVYNKIRIRLKKDEKETFRKEQLKWLKKRDAHFKKIRKTEEKNEYGIIGNDLKMIIADKQAEFVFERVEELMKRL